MKDNENFKVSFVAIVLVLMFLFTVSVLVQPGISGNEKGNFIQNFDQDKDGKVSKEEFRGSDRAFNRFVRNHDGFIDKTEVPKGPPPQGPPQGQKAGPPPHGARGDGFIQNFDQDKDGKVSKEEFRGSDQRFNRLDRNHDGFIDKIEVPKGPPPQGQKAGPPPQGQKAGPPPQGQKAGPPPQGARGGDFIQNFDQDKDGKVSKEEFRGSDQGFNRLDRNHDGFIDGTEVPKGPPTQRPKKKAE